MLTSALALLRERGANGVTLDAVLAHSGAPRGSIYHHFPGGPRPKTHLFRTLELHDSMFSGGVHVRL